MMGQGGKIVANDLGERKQDRDQDHGSKRHDGRQDDGPGGKIVLNILNCMESWSRFHTRIVTMILDKIIFSKSVI